MSPMAPSTLFKFIPRFLLVLPFIVSPFTESRLSNPEKLQRREEKTSALGGYLPKSADHNGVHGGKPFVPFYVPTGSEVLYAQNISRQLKFKGRGWKTAEEGHDPGKETIHPGDSVEFVWSGQGVESFGYKAGEDGRGVSKIGVYLDGKPQAAELVLQCHTGKAFKQQLIFRADYLSSTEHTLEIVHEGKEGELLSIFAFVTTDRTEIPKSQTPIIADHQQPKLHKFRRASADQRWTLLQKGNTGVAAMQLSVISDTEAIIIDKVEHNLLTVGGHPAWAAIYNLETNKVRPLNPVSNSFCAAGSFLGNGTLINIGGNPVVTDLTGAADFGDLDGLQSIRLFTPCNDGRCDILEFPRTLAMTSARWYPSVTRLPDGSVMIIGGSKRGGWKNTPLVNNPTIEYFPPKKLPFAPGSPHVPVHSPFLVRTLASNLYPIVISLPITDTVFMAANNDAMLYNWRTGVETPLPPFPNGVRVTYPFSGTGILLPLKNRGGYVPEVLICGGSAILDTLTDKQVKVSTPASDQCVRMVLDARGIKDGWEVERMPQPRIMLDAVMMPDGKVLIVNGGMTGTAGYGNLRGIIGQSNSDHPAFTPVLYDPKAPNGRRFSSEGMPTSTIPRLYHSVATLTASGKVMIAGSNPNLDRTTKKYPTEYRVEWLSPPYIGNPNRPIIESVPAIANFDQIIRLKVSSGGNPLKGTIKVVLVDFGFVTHGVHMNSRLVHLSFKQSGTRGEIVVAAPPTAEIYPAGYGWIFVLLDGIPSEGRRIMIGSGKM